MFGGVPESANEFVNPEDLLQYLHGGAGQVTMYSPTGKTRTYKVAKPRHDQFADGTYFIYAQYSNGEWAYVGMVDPEDLVVIRTTHSKFPRNHSIFKGAEYLYDMATGRIRSTKMRVLHEGVCGACGRKLTDPKSIACGIGPSCRRKLNAERRHKTVQSMEGTVQQ